jgi:hypothetical protein
MNLDNNILAVVEPALMPTPIEIEDVGESGGGDRQTKAIGINVPFVLLNNYQFQQADVQSFLLNNSGVLPEVSIKLVDRKNTFGVDSFPRDGDSLTIMMNSKNASTFKSIHMDFDITNISARQTSEGAQNIITVNGIAKIPRLYAEECRHFENASSLDHLEEVARDLQLGLATNIDNADDLQTRIQAFVTTYDFIKDTVDTSYVSEDSFQIFYIDQYYYLTYIDVNRVFNSPNTPLEELQASMVSMTGSLAERGGFEDEGEDDVEAPLLLTNYRQAKGFNHFINEFRLVNNSSEISILNGYSRDVVIYDDNSDAGERKQEFTVEALTSEELLDYEEPLKGRRNEDRYETQKKYKYIGRQDVGADGLGNAHASSNFAKLHQAQNLAEIEKVKLKVVLESFNPSIYKYQKIPVLIYEYNKERVDAMLKYNKFLADQGFTDKVMGIDAAQSEDGEDARPTQALNRFLSGYYVIENINYKYSIDFGNIIQEVTLIRREWPGGLTNYPQ